MKIAVLGTGMVGNALRTKLVQIGNEVAMGSRNTNNEKAAQWVKPLNTVNCEIMIAPSRVPGDHNLFICGNDASAKKEVVDHLNSCSAGSRRTLLILATSPPRAEPK